MKVVKPVTVDPPSYTACIAGLRADTPAKPTKSSSKHKPSAPPSNSALELQCQTEYQRIKPNALERLIEQDWILREANQLGLKVTSAEIQQHLSKTKQEFESHGGYQKFLKESGATQADLLREFTYTVLRGKVSTKVSTKLSNEAQTKASSQGIPHAQIAAYYRKHLQGYYEHPETREAQLIVTESQSKAQMAKREISSGKSFASVEKMISEYPQESVRNEGGKIGPITKGAYEKGEFSMPGASTQRDLKAFENAVFTAKEHTLVGPIKTSEAYFLIQVNGISKGEPTEALSHVESSIRQTLTGDLEQQIFSHDHEVMEKRRVAMTTCAKGFIVPDCKQYKAPKEPSLLEQSEMHGREAEAMKKQQEHEIELRSSALIKPSLLAMQNNVQPRFARRYTCDGADISPPFTWRNLPPSTAELLLDIQQVTNRRVRSDIWVVGGLNPKSHGVAAGSLPRGAVVGRNSSGKASWGGICPPRGAEYGYSIELVPLSKKLGLKPGFDLKSLGRTLKNGHVRSNPGLLVASYKRR